MPGKAVSKVYCPKKGCPLVSMSGSFTPPRLGHCIQCGSKMSTKPGKR
jgi:hypothetical protein